MKVIIFCIQISPLIVPKEFPKDLIGNKSALVQIISLLWRNTQIVTQTIVGRGTLWINFNPCMD